MASFMGDTIKMENISQVEFECQNQYREIKVYGPDLDWKIISDLMNYQELIAHDHGGIVHVSMSSEDHHDIETLKMDLIENGANPENLKVTCKLSHTVGNALNGLPDLICINLPEGMASDLINELEHEMSKKSGYPIDEPFMMNGKLIQLVPTKFEHLNVLEGAFESLVAMQILTEQEGFTPEWLQIVYADRNYRFPWEPGAGQSFFQPVPARPHKYRQKTMAQA